MNSGNTANDGGRPPGGNPYGKAPKINNVFKSAFCSGDDKHGRRTPQNNNVSRGSGFGKAPAAAGGSGFGKAPAAAGGGGFAKAPAATSDFVAAPNAFGGGGPKVLRSAQSASIPPDQKLKAAKDFGKPPKMNPFAFGEAKCMTMDQFWEGFDESALSLGNEDDGALERIINTDWRNEMRSERSDRLVSTMVKIATSDAPLSRETPLNAIMKLCKSPNLCQGFEPLVDHLFLLVEQFEFEKQHATDVIAMHTVTNMQSTVVEILHLIFTARPRCHVSNLSCMRERLATLSSNGKPFATSMDEVFIDLCLMGSTCPGKDALNLLITSLAGLKHSSSRAIDAMIRLTFNSWETEMIEKVITTVRRSEKYTKQLFLAASTASNPVKQALVPFAAETILEYRTTQRIGDCCRLLSDVAKLEGRESSCQLACFKALQPLRIVLCECLPTNDIGVHASWAVVDIAKTATTTGELRTLVEEYGVVDALVAILVPAPTTNDGKKLLIATVEVLHTVLEHSPRAATSHVANRVRELIKLGIPEVVCTLSSIWTAFFEGKTLPTSVKNNSYNRTARHATLKKRTSSEWKRLIVLKDNVTLCVKKEHNGHPWSSDWNCEIVVKTEVGVLARSCGSSTFFAHPALLGKYSKAVFTHIGAGGEYVLLAPERTEWSTGIMECTITVGDVLGLFVKFRQRKELPIEDHFLSTTTTSQLSLQKHSMMLQLDLHADITNLPKMRQLDNSLEKWCDQNFSLDSDLAQTALASPFLPSDVLELARKTMRTVAKYELLRERSALRAKEHYHLRSLVSKLVHLKLINPNRLHTSLREGCEDGDEIATTYDVLEEIQDEASQFGTLLSELNTEPVIVANTLVTNPSAAISAVLTFFQETIDTVRKQLHDGIFAVATLCHMDINDNDEAASPRELKHRFQVAHGIWRGTTKWDALTSTLEGLHQRVDEESKRLDAEETIAIEVLRTHKDEIEEAFRTACDATKIHDSPDTTSQIVRDLIQSSKRVSRHRRDIRNAKERHQDAVDDGDDEEEIAARAAAVQQATEELALITAELRVAFHKHYTIISRLFPTEKQALDEAFSPNCEHGAPFDPAASLSDFTIETDNGSILYAKQGSEAVVIKRFETHSRFAQECRVYTELHSCHFVAKQRKVFCESGKHYAVMPRYPGGTLHAWVLLHNNDAGAFLRAMSDTCKGLADLHARGFVHCDIKPDNIVMKSKLSDAAPCIIDFDCSRTAKEGAQALVSTTTKHLGGTLAFVAPEVLDCVTKGDGANLEALRSPAIDIYALGRTLMMLICSTDLANPINMGGAIFDENDNDGGSKFVIPTDEDESRLGAALAPVAEKLERLINDELLCVDPTKRASAMKVQETLEGLRRQLVATREEAVAVAQAPGQCCICSRQMYAMELVRCSGTTNEDGVGVSSSSDTQYHAYCAECLVPMISSWSQEPLAIHVERGGTIVCGYGECCGELNATEVVRLGGAEVQEQIMRVMVQIGESAAATQLKEQAEQQSLQQRAVLHVDEEILAVRCPKCKARFAINFDECLALKCSQCRTHFCGYCGMDCGRDAHSHITQKQCPALKGHAEHAKALSLFTKAPQWRKVWVEYHRKELDAYLSTLPQEVKDKVVKQCDI